MMMMWGVAEAALFRATSQGWNTTFFNANRAMTFNNPNQYAESLTYQVGTGKIITSNIAGGATYSFPMANGPKTVDYVVADQAATSPLSLNGLFGVVTKPQAPDLLFACIGKYPATQVSTCAMEVVNMTAAGGPAITQTYSFQRNPAVGMCLINDLVVNTVAGTAYATDYIGYQLVKVTGIGTVSPTTTILSRSPLLCTATGAQCKGGRGYGGNGPNGIAMYTDSKGKEWLLVGVVPNRLVKVDPVSGNVTEVMPGLNTPPNGLIVSDGMDIFNNGPVNSVLFAVGYPGAGASAPMGSPTVSAITSTDEWATYNVRTVYNASCPSGSGYSPTVRVATGTDLIVLCNNNFQAGLQQVNVLEGVGSSPIATRIETILTPGIVPEAFGYDSNLNMLVMGSLSFGGITGYPYNQNSQVPLTHSSTDKHVYIQPSLGQQWLGINVNPMNIFGSPCYALACMDASNVNFTSGKATPVSTALYIINLCNNSVTDSIILPGGLGANDVTVLDGVAYVSDYLTSDVFAVDINGLTLSNARVAIPAGSMASNDATQTLTVPDGMETVIKKGGNSYILVSSLQKGPNNGNFSPPGGLFKYVPNTNVLTFVADPTGIVSGLDGMKFNADRTILYGARQAVSGTPFQTVVAAVSCDDWTTTSLAFSFQTDCGGKNPPALLPILNTKGKEDLVIMCGDGFGPGPYSFETVLDADTIVSNTGICSIPTPSPSPPIPTPSPSPPNPTPSPSPPIPTPSNSNTSTDASKPAAIALGVILAFVLFMGGVWFFVNKRPKVEPPPTPPTKVQPPPATDVELAQK
jgi:hypothetical protein